MVLQFIVKLILEVQIMFADKAQIDSKAERTRQYVSILSQFATKYADIRWTSKISF